MIAGIDYSTTSPAIALFDETKGDIAPEKCEFAFCFLKPTKKQDLVWSADIGNIFPATMRDISSHKRFFHLTNWAMSILIENGVKELAIENYSMGSTGKVFHIAENTGLLKHYCHLAGIKVFVYPPTVIKKKFSGKGNAKKDEMGSVFIEKYEDISLRIECKDISVSPACDVVDAYAILETHMRERKC